MAASAVTVVVTDTWSDGKRQHVIGTIAIGASPGTYVTNGLSVLFTDIKIKSTKLRWMQFKNLFAGSDYYYDPVNKTIRINLEGAAIFAEMTNGTAIPAGVSGDSIDFYGIFDQLR